MIMYKLLPKDYLGDTPKVVVREDGAYIPFDPDNTDYQAYLAWVAEGNQPQEAE
jgi:hypothetical protein